MRRNAGLALIAGAAPLAAGISVWTGELQDYRDYAAHWSRLLYGGERHITSYGPLFDALAMVAAVDSLAPKLLFVAVWLGAAAWLTHLAGRLHPERPGLALALALFLLNPWFWSEVAVYAHFDVLVAACCLAAVHSAGSRRPAAAGLALAAGALLKFVPLALLPGLLPDPEERRLRLRLPVVVLLVCGAVFGVAYGIDGAPVLDAFRFGVTRESSGFSPFDYLRGPHSFLHGFVAQPNLDAWSTPAILAVGALTTLLIFAYRIDGASAALLLTLVVLTLYRAGHSQFYLLPGLLAPYWVVQRLDDAPPRWPLISLAIYFAWLLIETGTWLVVPPPWFDSLDGLFHLGVSLNLYAALLRDAVRRSGGFSLRYRLAW